LTSHLTDTNHCALLESVTHKSKLEVQHFIASLHPQAPVQSSIRKLPAPKPPQAQETMATAVPEPTASDALLPIDAPPVIAPPRAAPPRSMPVVTPLAPELYKLQVTMSRETHEKLRRAQDLLRHTIPNGDPAAIIDRTLTLLLATVEKDRLGATSRPRAARGAPKRVSRTIPASVRRQVWARDGGQCAFVGNSGRCTERGFLEFHHVVPFVAGGAATVDNIELRCRAHNAYESELFFGPLIARERVVDYVSSFRTELSRGDAYI
jgi:hypothetical protein